MRALAVLTAMALGGCSALYNGHDLHGTGGGGSGGGSGGAGGGGGGGAGGGGGGGGGGAGGGGGGGGTSGCTPRATIKFTQTTPSAAAMGPYFIALSDINKDGKLDIVTANYSANSFSVLLGDGAGGFTLAASTPVSTCNTPQIVLTRDISNDGLDDVIIACYTNSGPAAGVDVFVNQSTTTMVKFAARKQVTLASMNGLPYTVTGKFVGDANVDLAIVDPNGNTVRLYAGDGAGNFTLSATTYPTGMGGSWMTVGDLNGDSADDIVVYNETDDDMTMLLSKSGGGFNTPVRLAYDTTAMGTLYFVTAPMSLFDINHDGLLDIIATEGAQQPGNVEPFINTGTTTAPAFPATPTNIPTGDRPVAQGFADFNCDGTVDLAVSSNGCDQSNAPPNCPNSTSQAPWFSIIPGHGAGWDAAITTTIPLGAYNFGIADFNGDGYPDIAAASGGTTVTVMINAP